jgi:CRISPR-associated endonuclease Cas2
MVVICYDIKDDKILRKVAKFLEERGIRAQRSFFELDISFKKGVVLLGELKNIIEENDKVFLFEIKNKEDIQSFTSIERIF